MTHDTEYTTDAQFRPGADVSATAMPDPFRNPTLTELASEIVAAYVAHNSVPASDLPALLSSVYGALARLGRPVEPAAAPALVPAVPVKKSVTDHYIVSLLDGKRYKSLKRHIGVAGYTPESYRAAFGLPFDYPMVAPAYAKARSELARAADFGKQRRKR